MSAVPGPRPDQLLPASGAIVGDVMTIGADGKPDFITPVPAAAASLSATLVVGNETLGRDIVLTGSDAIRSADSSSPADIQITGGTASGSGGGAMLDLRAGGSFSGTGGMLTMSSGENSSGGKGGIVQILAAASAGPFAGANSTFQAGAARAVNRAGGIVRIFGGSALGAGGTGGGAEIAGGIPTDGDGGAASVIGRDGVGTDRSGGDVNLTAGAKTGAGVEGRVLLTSGERSYPLTATGAGPLLGTGAQTIIEAINELSVSATTSQGHLATGVFKFVSGTVSTDTEAPTLLGDFQAWDALISSSAGAEAHVSYEGRLTPEQSTITSIAIPIKGTGTYSLKVYVEGGVTINPAFDSGVLAAMGARDVTTILAGDMSAQPTGEGRYFVVVEAFIDAAENVRVGLPFVKQD